MNNLKRIIKVVLCLSFILCMTVFAEADFSGVNNDTEITVNGIAGEKNSFVSLTVLKPGFSKEDAEAEFESAELPVTELSPIMWIGHTMTSENGEFSFKIKFPEEAVAADYKLYAFCGEEAFEGVLRYVSNTNKIESVKAFNGVTDLSSLNKAIEENSFTLSIFAEDEEAAALYEKYKENEKLYSNFSIYGDYSFEIEKLNESAELINKNLKTALSLVEIELCEEKASLISFVENNGDFLGIDISGITDNNKEYVYDSVLALENITKAEEIEKVIADSVILYEIVNAENWGRIKTVYETYAEKLEIDVSSGKVDYTKVYREIYSGREAVDSVEKASLEFNRLCRKYPKQTASAGGGSGGGGGVSRPVPDTGVVSKPVITGPVKEEIEEEVKLSFSDVPRDFWAYEPVKALYGKGIIKGMEENRFGANNNITREEVAALTVRAFGLSLKESTLIFKDVSSEAWYAAEVMIAASNGVLKGYPDGTFGAGKSITRQDLAVMLYNTLTPEEKLSSEGGRSFTDEESISAYALEAVKAMSSEGIINGYEDGSFRPGENATRAEVASLIYKLLDRVAK